MNTFDDIEVRRPALARSYLALLAAQPGRPLALFAPRRIGKTFFLDHDLAPEATREGLLPVYADLWLHQAAPLAAINHALEEALDDLLVPAGRVGKAARTPVRKVGVLGTGIDFGEEPDRRPLPESPDLRLDALVSRLAKQHGGPILLMLDEAQTLGDAGNGVATVASLRAVLHKRRTDVRAVFTGSSQDGLVRLLNTAGAPMYQFAQLMDFPFLDDEFLQLLANHFGEVHPGKALGLDELHAAFQAIGYKPALMRDLVKAMSAEGITDVKRGVDHYLASDQQIAIWRALLHSVDAFEHGVLVAIANGHPPLSQATVKSLAAIPGAKPTIAKVRSAMEKLKRIGLLAKTSAGTRIDDPLLVEFLRRPGGRALPIGTPGPAV